VTNLLLAQNVFLGWPSFQALPGENHWLWASNW
jgi:hypothetical protein